MSCSGHHFSVHSPECKAHMQIQSNRPIQVEPLGENSRVTTPNPQQQQMAWLGRPQQVARLSPGSQVVQIVEGGVASSLSPGGSCEPTGQAGENSNYTLVILDCSPHPSSPAERVQQISPSGQHALQLGLTSGGEFQASGLAPSSCHCQTELIVRQQIEHDPACMQHGHQFLEQQQQQQQRGSYANEQHHLSSSGTTTTRISEVTHENEQRALREIQPRADSRQDRTTVHEQSGFGLQEERQERWQEQQQQQQTQTRRQQRHTHDENFLEPGARRQADDQLGGQFRENPNQQQQQQKFTTSETLTETTTERTRREARPGTRLVKRWNWNQAQFVEEEVEERPRARVPPPVDSEAHLSVSRAHHLQAAGGPSSGSSSRASASQAAPAIWNHQHDQELASLGLSPVPPPGAYDPSWLAFRKPDEESVQADPLYRDLMAELARLEEGVSSGPQQQQPPPQITPDCQQKPVFGQPLQPEQVELNEFESVEFIGRLIPNSDPTMRVEWTKNGRPLLESSRLTCEYEFGVVRLVIRKCEAEDSGIYQCRASNLLGETVSRTRLLVHAKGNVQYETLHPAGLDKIRALENPPEAPGGNEDTPLQQPPKFLTHIQDYVEKDEGESVHFECCLAPVDDPDMKTEWFFNGRPLVTGSRFHTIDDFGFIVLDIDWLFPRDTGEYICRATNKHGSDFTRTVMRVRPAKAIVLESQLNADQADATMHKLRQLEFPDVPAEVYVEQEKRPAHFVEPLRAAEMRRDYLEGDQVSFEARAGPATDGELTVDWFHNGKPLISGSRFRPTFDFGHILLDILYLYPEDSGLYKCVARNAQGEAESEFEIRVQGKQAIVYQSQLPEEMRGGVEKITEMEAMWNRAPDPEEEEAPAERMAPQFVLKPKPCTAFEGSCARFCCRIVAHPRPRVAWFINDQLVVSGSRYKLTHDGMYHLIIPKCALSDAGRVEVRARNLLGECRAACDLQVKRKVDDYRGVLKNSPNPWYDEQTLNMYRRQRLAGPDGGPDDDDNPDEDFEEFLLNFQRQRAAQLAKQQQQQTGGGNQLRIATELTSTSPLANQVIGYMEPGTPDVNLLLSSAHSGMAPGTPRSPLVEPGDLHPVVIEQQAIMAPAPSTIQRALRAKDSAGDPQQQQVAGFASPAVSARGPSFPTAHAQTQQQHGQQHRTEQQTQPDLTRGEHAGEQTAGQQQQQRAQADDSQQRVFGLTKRQANQQHAGQRARMLPPASPESTEHGHEIHSHFHTQLQVERRQNKEITREIIEKETFEQEHRGASKDRLTTSSESDAHQSRSERGRSVTPTRLPQHPPPAGGPPPSSVARARQSAAAAQAQQQQQQTQTGVLQAPGAYLQDQRTAQQQHEQQFQQQQQQHVQVTLASERSSQRAADQQQVLIEDFMVPPEFTQKIQPCQAIDGDEARFECSFRGEPKPSISWYRESKLLKNSNLYSIETDLGANKSTLIIKRVGLNGNAVYTVKAENAAGSAKSSANLVVEPHPLPQGARGGHARPFDALDHLESAGGMGRSSASTTTTTTTTAATQFSANSAADMRGFSPTTMSDFNDDSLSSEIFLTRANVRGPNSTGSQQDYDLTSQQQQQKVIKSVRTRRLSPDEMTSLIRASPDNLVAPSFLHTIHEVHSRPGELARLDARLIGSQPMEVKWLRDGERVRPDKQHKLLLEGDLYTLLILECSQADEGHYECVASNAVGEARCGASLRVSPEGRLSSASQHEQFSSSASFASAGAAGTAMAGATSFMISGAGGSRQASGYATQAGQQTQTGQQAAAAASTTTTTTTTSVTTQVGQQGTTVAPPGGGQRQHFGQTKKPHHQLMSEYTPANDSSQQSTVVAGEEKRKQQVAAIPKLIKGLEDQQVREGKSVTLRCQISAFPKAEVSWFKLNDKPIKPSKYFRIFKDNDETHCLKILEVFPEDQGPYRCVARAQHGQVETSAFISVLPSSPK